MNEFGEYLKELRGRRSLREMERITGLSHTYLSTLEKGRDPRSGKERKPTPEVLKQIADAIPEVKYLDLMKKAGYIKTFGKKIKELREENGWSVDILECETINFEYGEPIFVSKNRIKEFENEIAKNPSIYEIYLLSTALNVCPWEICTMDITTPKQDIETFLSTTDKPEPINFTNNALKLLEKRYHSTEAIDNDKNSILEDMKVLEENKLKYIDQLNKLSASGKNVVLGVEDGNKYVNPLLDRFKEQGGETEYELTFSVPMYENHTENGITFTKKISQEEALKKFFELENLLNSNVDLINYKGKSLSQNDIRKIISVIFKLKDTFEYKD